MKHCSPKSEVANSWITCCRWTCSLPSETGVSPTPPHPHVTCWPLRALEFACEVLWDRGMKTVHGVALGIRTDLVHWERVPLTLKEVAAPRWLAAFSEWQLRIKTYIIDI